MVPVKHIIYEQGVSQIFKLIVPEGNHAGTYEIKMPDGWNEIDSVINMNEETLNVEDFIIGSSEKLKFSEFTDRSTFNLIRNVYREFLGDARVLFKWIAVKNGIEYDLLSENFEINFNNKKESFDKSLMKTEVELVKSEIQNKLYTREDTTVDLFETKDLDDKDIVPVQTFNIGYKKGDKILTNFYTFDLSQFIYGATAFSRLDQFFSFQRSDDYEFGDNSNALASYQNYSSFARTYQGPFVGTNITLKRMKVEINDLRMSIAKSGHTYPNCSLYAVIRNGETVIRMVFIKKSESFPVPGGGTDGIIDVEYGLYDIGTLDPGQNLTFEIRTDENVNIGAFPEKTNTTIKLTINMDSPMVKTKGIRLIDGISQIAKNYTSGGITAESFILGPGGSFYNTSISTGMYLRGLPPIYLSQKLKSSMKSLFQEGAAKLLALGYDLLDNKMIVEDIGYFFKDYKCYDLSQKQYLTEGFSLENDKELSFNNLSFGSKKFSTNVKFDIKNFNTTVELSTPIKTNKSKFDKQTDLIIDEFKIQELIEDKSSATNSNDDDKVLIDMVEASDIWDSGVFENCSHSEDGGVLLLNCNVTPFDTTLIEVGNMIEITEGPNAGTWQVLSIEGSRMKVNKTTGIQTIAADTPIRYKISSLIKNRTDEGFFVYGETIFSPSTTTNIRHNPKYQMARWWPLFGSGLRKKLNTENLKVASYKNNSEAKMKIVSSDMANEMQGDVLVGGNEELSRMRDFERTFFNGEKIEISYSKITFEEFLKIYSNWRYGEGNDRNKSRGYLSCNTPYGIYDLYPFGSEAFRHNKKTNTLTIKAKVKGRSVESPVLLSVIQVNGNTFTLSWDYSDEYINPAVKIQYSFDGNNWETVHEVNNIKTATFSNPIFNGIMTGATVYFRIIASTGDYYNKVSNSLPVVWQFNDWIVKEFSKNENTNCGYSYMSLEIRGTANLEIKWSYSDYPGGGNYSVVDSDTNTVISSFSSGYGFGETHENTTAHSLTNETKYFNIQLKNSDKTELGTVLNCSSGNVISSVNASLFIQVKDMATGLTTEFNLIAETTKRYRQRPPNPQPPVIE